MHHLRLTHPNPDFWVDVRPRELDRRWLAVEDLAGTPEIGGGGEPWGSLRPFGPRLAAESTARALVRLR